MSAQAVRIALSRPTDWDSVAAEWRALEERTEASFFQSWTWLGCRVAERFDDPVLLRASLDGDLVGLALLNRRGRTLYLGETGDPARDAVYVEYNGPLALGHAPAILRALLDETGWRGSLRLSGVSADLRAMAETVGVVRVRHSAPAPYVDLAALGGDYLASLSANTRHQIRRSDRSYGGVAVRRAATVAEGLVFLDALAALHRATWTARGLPGAFANPAFTSFHRALIARALPRGEAELLHVQASGASIGYLYNVRHRGRILAYQSGFDYRAPRHAKPGLTCHHAAIRLARADGMRAYDFLAGGDRYKRSLSNAATVLYWLEAARRCSPRGLLLRLRQNAAS